MKPPIRYGSVCSGVEAATLAWHGLGWQAQWYSEFDKFPSAVLNHHYPNVPNLGDMTKIRDHEKYGKTNTIDLLVGGTPCQSFSVAGLRKGLDDERGNLSLEFCRLATVTRPKWLLWENVPGVLSSDGGRDFANIIRAFTEIGYGVAWRVLDAQYFGLAQRRKRIFVVGYLGDPRPAEAVLLEPRSLLGDTAPSRYVGSFIAKEPKEEFATYRQSGFGGFVDSKCAATLTASGGALGGGSENYVIKLSNTKAEGRNISEADLAYTLDAGGSCNQATTQGDDVRRLTPIECERLQGFPDNYTKIPWRGKPAEECPDGPRYKAIGNSMAVPVMRWIGERIQMVDDIIDGLGR